MKNIILLSLVTLSLVASENGNELYLYGASYHTNRNLNFNEVNPGVGIGHYWEKKNWLDLTIQATVYRNSYSEWTAIATGGPRFILGERDKLNFFASVNVGYMWTVGYFNISAMPCAGVSYDRFSANFVFIPSISTSDIETSHAIGFFVGYKF
jgi:hypothetical protein